MITPIWCNAAEISTFRYGKEDYVLVTYFFHAPVAKNGDRATFRPPIEYIPCGTFIMPRQAYKAIVKKFLGHIARQEEGKVSGKDAI